MAGNFAAAPVLFNQTLTSANTEYTIALPTLHQKMTVADILSAAKTLEQWALSLPVNPPEPPELPPVEKWDK